MSSLKICWNDIICLDEVNNSRPITIVIQNIFPNTVLENLAANIHKHLPKTLLLFPTDIPNVHYIYTYKCNYVRNGLLVLTLVGSS